MNRLSFLLLLRLTQRSTNFVEQVYLGRLSAVWFFAASVLIPKSALLEILAVQYFCIVVKYSVQCVDFVSVVDSDY